MQTACPAHKRRFMAERTPFFLSPFCHYWACLNGHPASWEHLCARSKSVCGLWGAISGATSSWKTNRFLMCPCGAYTGRCASTDAAGRDGGGLFCPSGRWQTLLMRVLVGVACVNLAGVCGDLIWNGSAGGGHDRDHAFSAWPLPENERRRGSPMTMVFNWFNHL